MFIHRNLIPDRLQLSRLFQMPPLNVTYKKISKHFLQETNKPKPPPLQGTSLDPFERFQKELFTRTDRITDNNTQGTSFDWAFTVSPEYFEDVVQQLVLREWSKNGEENEIIFTDNYTYLINEKLPSHTIVVTGEPGSGKSTYVAKIAKDWAKGNPILRHWFSLVFFIRCQEFGNKIDTSDDTSFGEELRRLMMKNNDYDLFPDIMKDNGTLIIFDGFDENPLPEIFNLLKTPRSIKLKEAEYCPEATFIITTRPEYATIGHEYEIKTERPDKDSMKSMSINLLKIPGELIKGIRVEGFSKETAHKYLRVRLGDDTDILEGLDEEMIRNPLYATMLCALGKKKIQEIQIKPYQFRKKLIFDEFDRLHRRHVVESKEAIISTEYQKYIAEAKKLAVAVCLERYADDRIKLPKYDELNGKLLGKLCLIRCNNTQRYTFIHRTFEEYYAAVWLIENLKEQIFLVEKILKDNHKEIIYFLMGFEPELLRSYLQNRRICLLPVTLEVISSLQKHLDKKYKLSIYDWKINGPDFVEMFKAIAKYREIYFYRCIIDCDSMSSGEWGIYNQQGFYFIDCQLNAKAFCTFVSAKKTPWIRLIDTKINASPDLLADQEYPEICNFRIVGKYGLKNVQLVVPLIEKSGFNKIKRQEKWLGLADFSIDADELIDLMKRVAKTHAVFLSLSLKIDNVDAITTSYNHTSINRIKLDIRHSHYEQKNIIAALSLIQKIKLNELIIQDRTEKKESVLERLLVSLLDLGVTKSLNLLKLQLHCNFQQLNISLLNLIHSCTTILNVVIQIKESCEKIASIPDHKPNWIDDAAYEVMKNLLQPNRPNQFELYTDETLWRD